jgi:hypothetical protein
MTDFDDDEFDKSATIHYASVGKVAAIWAGLEHLMQMAIWRLARVDNLTGVCITAQIGNSGRLLDAITALLRLRGATDIALKPLLTFSEKVGRRQRKRNRIVHDEWVFRLDGQPSRFEVSANRLAVYDIIPHSTDEVEDFVKQIIALCDEFNEILSDPALPQPLPEKHP